MNPSYRLPTEEMRALRPSLSAQFLHGARNTCVVLRRHFDA